MAGLLREGGESFRIYPPTRTLADAIDRVCDLSFEVRVGRGFECDLEITPPTRVLPQVIEGFDNGSGWSSRSAVRTGRLRRSLAVHSRPIDLVVFQEPSGINPWKPGLGGGFALRCLQRLSVPNLATRRCPERDSRHTRGWSSPILSY